METSQIVLSLFAVALCVVPVWWLVYAGNAKNRLLKNKLKDLSGQKKIKNDQLQIWSNKGLVVTESGTLYYASIKDDNTFNDEKIELSQLEDCQVMINGSQQFNGEVPGLSGVRSLSLKFSFRNNSFRMISLYDASEDDAFEQNQYLQIGKKWKNIIIEKYCKNNLRTVAPPERLKNSGRQVA